MTPSAKHLFLTGVYDKPTNHQVFAAALPAIMNFDSTKYPRVTGRGWRVGRSTKKSINIPGFY